MELKSPLEKYAFHGEIEEKLNSFFSLFGLTILSKHLHEIIFSFFFYEAIYLLSRLFSPLFCKSYKKLSKKNQTGFDIHVVSQFQAIIILILIIPVFFDDELKKDTLLASSSWGSFVCAMACGYFIWDTYICLSFMHLYGPLFAIHAIAALIVFIQSFRPFLQSYSAHFMMFELSTPFVNIHWFASHFPKGTISEKTQTINGILLMLTFFSARIIWGFYAMAILMIDFWNNLDRIPIIFPIVTCLLNFALDILNVIWFSKMVKIAYAKFSAKDEKKIE